MGLWPSLVGKGGSGQIVKLQTWWTLSLEPELHAEGEEPGSTLVDSSYHNNYCCTCIPQHCSITLTDCG
jgi:hypothetical protein